MELSRQDMTLCVCIAGWGWMLSPLKGVLEGSLRIRKGRPARIRIPREKFSVSGGKSLCVRNRCS